MMRAMADEIGKIAMPDFLDQDRPESVKKIYRALKRDHPDMPAEMKARIAGRQGKKGHQKQGPPYDGPIKKWKEKKAEEETPEETPKKSFLPSKEEFKQLGKNVGVYGLGMGVGAPLGWATKKYILPKTFPHMGPKATAAAAYGGSALLGLLGAGVGKKFWKSMEDAKSKRDS